MYSGDRYFEVAHTAGVCCWDPQAEPFTQNSYPHCSAALTYHGNAELPIGLEAMEGALLISLRDDQCSAELTVCAMPRRFFGRVML